MKGQLSIDYIAGALVFFAALVLLISNVLGTIPQLEEQYQTNELQLTAWSLSEVLLHDRGYWSNATENGTNWHVNLRTQDTEALGLQGANGLSREKLQALQNMNYQRITNILHINTSFNMELTEFLYIDTHRSFTPGSDPGFITEPTYSGNVRGDVQYGSERIDGTSYYFLLANTVGWPNSLWVSEDWNFTDATYYNLSTTSVVTLEDNTYLANPSSNQISEGRALILQRRVGRVGTVPSGSVDDIRQITRYGVMDGNVVKAVFRVWEE